jgi:hypothetical protein
MTTYDQASTEGDEITDDVLMDENAKLRAQNERLQRALEAATTGDPAATPSGPSPAEQQEASWAAAVAQANSSDEVLRVMAARDEAARNAGIPDEATQAETHRQLNIQIANAATMDEANELIAAAQAANPWMTQR